MIVEGAQASLREYVRNMQIALGEALAWQQRAVDLDDAERAELSVIVLEQGVHVARQCWELVTGMAWDSNG